MPCETHYRAALDVLKEVSRAGRYLFRRDRNPKAERAAVLLLPGAGR
jgi:hypothetical protein